MMLRASSAVAVAAYHQESERRPSLLELWQAASVESGRCYRRPPKAEGTGRRGGAKERSGVEEEEGRGER